MDGCGSGLWPDGSHYEGEWKRGRREGYGVFHTSDGSRYAGEWINDEYSGHGVLVHANQDRFEGRFQAGKAHGYGLRLNGTASIAGRFVRDRGVGTCVITQADGSQLDVPYQVSLVC